MNMPGPLTIIAILTVLYAASVSAGTPVQLEKVAFKATHVKHDEKIARVRLSADASTVHQIGEDGDVEVEPSDTITAQASIVDDSGESVAIEQAFLRFENKRTGKDNIYLMRKSGLDSKVDVNLPREIRADHDFWVGQDSYRVEVILGDERLKRSVSWLVTDSMKFADADAEIFKLLPRGVFDFDISVKKEILPEFEYPLPANGKRAPWSIVLVALIAVAVPLPVLLMIWKQLGVLPLRLPGGRHLVVVGGLQTCILAHILALIMFWFRWNIVTTWKVMGVIMVPTFLFMRSFLQENEESKR